MGAFLLVFEPIPEVSAAGVWSLGGRGTLPLLLVIFGVEVRFGAPSAAGVEREGLLLVVLERERVLLLD